MGDNALCHRSEVTNSQAAISARNLTLTLGTAEAPVEILRGVDLDVMPGETLAVHLWETGGENGEVLFQTRATDDRVVFDGGVLTRN